METKLIEHEDVEKLVDIHMRTFEGFFLTSLGEGFLKVFYKSCLRYKGTIGVGIYDDNHSLIGFAVGNEYSKGYYKNIILSNFFPFLMIGFKVILTRPKSIIRLIKNLDKIDNKKDDGKYAELVSIGIDPSDKGKGYGAHLIQQFELVVKERNQKKLCLTTDFDNNDKVIEFYKRSGYKIFYEFLTYPNRKMYKFIKVIE